MTHSVQRLTEVRSEYTSARLIFANLTHRVSGARFQRAPGYLSPKVDFLTPEGREITVQVRDYDVRFLDRVDSDLAQSHLQSILDARQGDIGARRQLGLIDHELKAQLASRFIGSDLVENDHVIPYTTNRDWPETQISNKGAILLHLAKLGFATPDFNLLAAGVYNLPESDRRRCLHDALHNLEKLSGRRLGDPDNPLLIAMRSAMPDYIPGFMPTYLNVGLTPALFPELPSRYGDEAASRIRLNNRRTILEALDLEAFRRLDHRFQPDLTRDENIALAEHIEGIIAEQDPALLDDPYHQIEFFLDQTYAYYDLHLDALRNFMGDEIYYPTMILQRMVCSVIDEDSYAGVLYSRHPRLGTGVHLQYARTIYGEDLMTGRLSPQEVHLMDPDKARADFPAVQHFWPRLIQLERIFEAPVMVEFTGVHGTFTILQVNQAQLSGVGMLTSVMNLHREGEIDEARVRKLIEPFHIRQLESDAIDPASFQDLTPFCRGVSVLPRSAVTGRLDFSGDHAGHIRRGHGGDNVILAKDRFTPTDAITMQSVDGICSLSPAAIHVLTTAQTTGIPSLLDLEKSGVCIGEDGHSLINREGERLAEGDWVTISSRKKTLFRGKARFTVARLLRFLDGEELNLKPEEKAHFESLACDYQEFRQLQDSVPAAEYDSLADLGHSLRSGKLRADESTAADFINQCFSINGDRLVSRLFDTALGMHLINQSAFRLLSLENKVLFLAASIKQARRLGKTGYKAGAFVIGSLVDPALPVTFWQSFTQDEIAFLLNEWVLHQKYRDVLSEVGERRISRAKNLILTKGLSPLRLHTGLVKDFMPLKLSAVDLATLPSVLAEDADPQTAEMIELLGRPYGDFFDFQRPYSVAPLTRLCDALGRPLPAPDDC